MIEQWFKQEIADKLGLRRAQIGTMSGPSRDHVGTKLALSWHQVINLMDILQVPQLITVMMNLLEWKDRTKLRDKYVTPLIEKGVVNMTIPDKPKSSKQQYYLTEKGHALLTHLSNRNQL